MPDQEPQFRVKGLTPKGLRALQLCELGHTWEEVLQIIEAEYELGEKTLRETN
jgi:hypothetical protein